MPFSHVVSFNHNFSYNINFHSSSTVHYDLDALRNYYSILSAPMESDVIDKSRNYQRARRNVLPLPTGFKLFPMFLLSLLFPSYKWRLVPLLLSIVLLLFHSFLFIYVVKVITEYISIAIRTMNKKEGKVINEWAIAQCKWNDKENW